MDTYQNEIQKITDYFWYINRTPFAWPLVLFVFAVTTNPPFFTDIELFAMFNISTGIAILAYLYQILYGKVPSLVFDFIMFLAVPLSVLCSICLSVYILLASCFVWWFGMTFIPQVQQHFSETCRRFCSYTGGDAIWEMRKMLTIPITPAAILLAYAPLMTTSFIVLFVSAIGMSFILAANWQSHQLEMTLDEWTYQLFGELRVKPYPTP